MDTQGGVMSRRDDSGLAGFRREVVTLLASRGFSGQDATRLVIRWDDYIRARWSMGRSPEAVADHLGRWQKERIVCPCKKNGDPSPRCKVHGKRRRTSRDASAPRVGEVYEAKTSGRRWKVVNVDGDRITMEPVGARSEGRLLWAKQSLKGMKQVSGVEGLLRFLGISPSGQKDDDKVVREILPDGRVVLRPKTVEGDKGGRRLTRKARRVRK